MKPEDEKLISRYLLGDLSDEERDRFEGRFFADDIFFQEVEAARDELIENYVRGALSGQERERFEDYFLASPSRRERVETTKALLQVASHAAVTEAPVPARVFEQFRTLSWQKLWLAAAAIIVLVSGAFFYMQSIRLQNRLDELERERASLQEKEEQLRQQLSAQQTNQEQLAEQLRIAEDERARLEQELSAARTGESVIASFTLNPVLVRDESKPPLLRIGPKNGQVRLRVNFDAPLYDSYRAMLETVEGKRVWHRAGLKASTRTVTLYIPANLLQETDYLMTLSGVTARGEAEEIGKYYFRVGSK